jgi:hypothetical protein
MDSSSTQRLIKKMLASSELMPETREELQEYLDDLEKGSLHPDDASYVEGLARRLGFAEGGVPAAGLGAGSGDDDDDDGGYIGNERASDTAAAVQAEMALRKVEQARSLVARLREPAAGDTEASNAATLDELDRALGDAAEALRRAAGARARERRRRCMSRGRVFRNR